MQIVGYMVSAVLLLTGAYLVFHLQARKYLPFAQETYPRF